MRQQRHAVRAGDHLERRQQHAAAGIPFEIDLGGIDQHRIIGRIIVDDRAGAGGDLAAEIGRQAVAAKFALQLAGQRQVGAIGQVLHAQGQQDVPGRNPVRFDLDRAHAVRRRTDHDAERPRRLASLAKTHRDAARMRAAQVQRDVVEGRGVAALLVVDHQRAVLEADLVEVLAVQSGQAEAVEPLQPGEEAAGRRFLGRRNRRGRQRLDQRRDLPRRQRQRRAGRHRDGRRNDRRRDPRRRHAGRQRARIVAGGNGDLTVRHDADREHGIDEVEAFGAQPAHQHRRHRQFDFGLRGTGDDGVIAVAHHNVANPYRDPDPAGPLDLGAANLDGVTLADIVLNRVSQPRCRHVEIDRPGAEPPPQRAEAAGHDDQQQHQHHERPLQPAAATRWLYAVPSVRIGQQPARAMIANLLMELIPIGIVPLRRLLTGARNCRLGRLVTWHCLSVQALMMRMIAPGICASIARWPLFRQCGSFAG